MTYKWFRILTLAAAPSLACGLWAQDPQTKPPDNTQQNQRDRAAASPTADNAKNNLSDRDAMQKIRKSLIDDKSLSTYAHNVKVIAQNGRVTLKGPVRSEDEKRTVEQRAGDVVGADNVTSEITVAPPKQK